MYSSCSKGEDAITDGRTDMAEPTQIVMLIQNIYIMLYRKSFSLVLQIYRQNYNTDHNGVLEYKKILKPYELKNNLKNRLFIMISRNLLPLASRGQIVFSGIPNL